MSHFETIIITETASALNISKRNLAKRVRETKAANKNAVTFIGFDADGNMVFEDGEGVDFAVRAES